MGLIAGVNKLNDDLEHLTGLVATRKELMIKQLTNSVLLFVILLVFGCLDFATLEFHGEYLTTASYWGTVATKLIAGICALNVGINMMLDNEIKKNDVLSREKKRYDVLITYKQSDFEEFIQELNLENRIKSYKSYINRKIYRLNKISRARDRVLYSSTLENRQEEKKHNWYCRHRQALEELKTDEYIQANLTTLGGNYRDIDPAAFELEVNGAAKIEQNKVTGSVARGRAKESSNVILTILGFSMLTTSFSLGANQEQFENQVVAFWHYVFKACEDVLIVGWQFFNGLLRTRNIVSSQLTLPYATRNAILEKYINWRAENHKADTCSYLELKKHEEIKKQKEEEPKADEEENIIVVSQEQFDSIKNYTTNIEPPKEVEEIKEKDPE